MGRFELPALFLPGVKGSYSKEELRQYTATAIKPYEQRIAELERKLDLDENGPLADIESARRQTLELIVKAGRRCAYDLAHAADQLPDKRSRELYEQRARMWQDIFNPAHGPKDYRHDLHREIAKLESEVYRLKSLCTEHGIKGEDPNEIPF